MNGNYTFNNYLVKESNRFAVYAAIAVSKTPGKAYNPFLVTGNKGTGKTHLLQAIGHYIQDKSDKKVIYITAENFAIEFIEAIRDKKTFEFKDKFRRNIDALLLDDIQFLTNRVVIQVELYYTLRFLLRDKKQIILSCDKKLSDLEGIIEELKPYFECGLNAELKPLVIGERGEL